MDSTGHEDEDLFQDADDTLPKDNESYKLKEYWDSRFQKEEKYEWLASYADLKDIIHQTIKPTDKILLVGCGNSLVGPEMVQDGFKNLVSSDFSLTVIENMKKRFPDQEWIVSDVKDLKEFSDGQFDIVFDKATMDALVTDEGSCWDPNEQTVSDCSAMCVASIRVLKQGGKFLQLTFQDPVFRKKYLYKPEHNWTQKEYHKINAGLGYHFFVAEKN